MDWIKWEGKEKLPKELIDKPLLFKLSKDKNNLQVGRFWENNQGQLMGVIGNVFAFDVSINSYRSLEDIVPEYYGELNESQRSTTPRDCN